jgi:hypothetical protein
MAQGSGSLIDVEKKIVLTNYHVVDEGDLVFVQFPVYIKGVMLTDKEKYKERIPAGQAIKGKVLYRDKSRDLAFVQLERVPVGTPAIPLAKASPRNNATVWNIGNAGAVKQVFRVTEGKVSGVGVEKFLVGGSTPESVFEVRAKMVTATNPTNPGDSGGPLFDKRGYQVAVTESGSTSASLVNHFVDVTEVRAFLTEKKITIKELSDEPDPVVEKKGTTLVTPPDKKTDTVVTPPKKDNSTTDPPKKDDTPAASAADEKAAADKLRSAKLFANGEDNRPVYVSKLQEIIKKWPTTTAGKEAKRLLDGLK